MKGLFLYGAKCQPWIWDDIKKYLADYEIEYVEYPQEVIKKSTSVEEISRWVYEKYLHLDKHYDFILGHSMGGLIALQLSALKDVNFDKTILVESFLRPSGDIYKNLMTKDHMAQIGDKILKMFKEEDINYGSELKKSFAENFDFGEYLGNIDNKVYGIYGNRGNHDYKFLLKNLNLSDDELKKIEIHFVDNSCHLPMLENTKELAEKILFILS